MNILQLIQSELKAPKDQRNNFGNYSYRSAESILTALKPILEKYNSALILRDSIESHGERLFVRSDAELYNPESKLIGSSTGYAEHAVTKKGMDQAQITGSASSYARKYALNGLLCIDDTKDADATNTHGKGEPSYQKKTQTLDGLI
tara:strand:+ start:4480 stop:4920 length:441 start_codon:yes stop_codon:yes gene_type:complete